MRANGVPAVHGGLRRRLVVRILATGLAAIAGSVVLVSLQIQANADHQAHVQVRQRAAQVATDVAQLFRAWHDDLLVASSDGAVTDWYTDAGRRTVQEFVKNWLLKSKLKPGEPTPGVFVLFPGETVEGQRKTD